MTFTKSSTNIAIVGAGSWATVFARILAENGHEITMWGRDTDLMSQIEAGENSRYLPGVSLGPAIHGTTDIVSACRDAEIVVIAVPSQVVRTVLTPLAGKLDDAMILSLVKGIETSTKLTLSKVIAQVTGVPETAIAVLSGPNLSGEIFKKEPTSTIIASKSEKVANQISETCRTSYFHTFTTSDVIGCEIGGTVKNIIAVATGISQGLGYGANTQADLITWGLAETSRLGLSLGAQPETFYGLAGLGDLVATCISSKSRNFSLGKNLGSGMSLEQSVAVSSGVPEAAKSCIAVWELAQEMGVEMPITAAVVEVIRDHQPADLVFQRLKDNLQKTSFSPRNRS